MFFLSLVQLAHWLQCTLAASQHSQIPDRSFRCAQRNLIAAGTVPPATSMLWVSSVGVFSSKLVIARAARVSNLEGCLFSLDTQSTHQTASYMSISASQRVYIYIYLRRRGRKRGGGKKSRDDNDTTMSPLYMVLSSSFS